MPARFACIPVALGPRSYEIWVGRGLLPLTWRKRLRLPDPSPRFFLVADLRLKALVRRMAKGMGTACAGICWLRGGEPTKTSATLLRLYAEAAACHLDRQSVVVAVGGGVIGDVAGFFAATYLRGLRVIHLPTTLMAQVDSAIGGKTGINLPCGKNLVGAFHQPRLVAADPSVLATLPDREFRAGLAEVIKYGVIADAPLFQRLENRLDAILRRDPKELSWVIARCAAIKARVVSRDEHETRGLRALLNFGHTIGHGLEAASRYGTLLHGEAVALGMAGALELSRRHAGLSVKDVTRVLGLIRRTGLPTHLPLRRGWKAAHVLRAMCLDKKAAAGRMRFVLLRKIGAASAGWAVEESEVRGVLARL